jgi:hypothetical protein
MDRISREAPVVPERQTGAFRDEMSTAAHYCHDKARATYNRTQSQPAPP